MLRMLILKNMHSAKCGGSIERIFGVSLEGAFGFGAGSGHGFAWVSCFAGFVLWK
jgi:hypothetical protein